MKETDEEDRRLVENARNGTQLERKYEIFGTP